MGIIARQGIKNYIITYIGVFLGFVNLLVLQPMVLSAEEIGLLRLLFSVSALFASIYPLGLTAFTTKYFPYIKNTEKGHHGYIGFIMLSSTVLFLIGTAIFYFFKPYILSKYAQNQAIIEEFNYIFPMSYFLGLFTMLSAYSASLFKTTVPSFLNEVVFRVVVIISIGLYYSKLISFGTLVFIYAFIYLLLFLVLIAYLKKVDTLNMRINWKIFNTIPKAEAMRFTLIMGFASLASISIRNIDSVFIGIYQKLSDIGIYVIAVTISSFIDVPGNALSKIVVPKLSEAFKNENHTFIKDIYYKSVHICLLSGGFLFLLIFLNAHALLSLLPAQYLAGEPVLKIIALGSFINMASGLNITFIQYSKKYTFGIVSYIGLALLSAISNILLIPGFGLTGAAMGTSFSIITVNLILFLYIKRHFNFQPYRPADGYILLTILIVVIADYFIPEIDNSLLSILVKSAGVGIIFLGVIIKLGIYQQVRNFLNQMRIKISG